MTQHTLQSGYSLIEVLISLLLLSLLLLGLDALQIDALHKSKANYYYSIASEQLMNITTYLKLVKNANYENQYNEWQSQNHDLLPQGKGCIKGSYPNYDISISWGNQPNCVCPYNKFGESGCLRIAISD